jgi:hypothetical protein
MAKFLQCETSFQAIAGKSPPLNAMWSEEATDGIPDASAAGLVQIQAYQGPCDRRRNSQDERAFLAGARHCFTIAPFKPAE